MLRCMRAIVMVGAALVLSTAARAQGPEAENGDVEAAPVLQDAAKTSAVRAWSDFRVAHPGSWRIRWDVPNRSARLIFGDNIPGRALATDEDFTLRAMELLDQHHELFGVPVSQLQVVSVNRSPLTHIGTTDKIGVELKQVVSGIEVDGSSATVLFLPDGRVTALEVRGVRVPAGLGLTPSRWEPEAESVAAVDLLDSVGVPADQFQNWQLVILPQKKDGVLAARLAWKFEVASFLLDQAGLPVRFEYFVDAHTAEVLDKRTMVHQADISGTVQAWVTPGIDPDVSGNPEILVPLEHLTVTLQGGATTTTDASGSFLFANQNQSRTVSALLRGPWARVENQAGGNGSVSATFQPDVPGSLIFNSSKGGLTTAETNAYYWVVNFRDWMLSVDPSFDLMGFQVLANVNLGSTCNAFFNGSSINMYQAGGGCVNTSYSTVVAHEEGHWANVLAGSGNGPDGFGEGAADVWSTYLLDDPIVGKDFAGPGNHVRDGNNTRQFCGDNNTGCYGQVHADGEVLMGAMWKVRDRLNTALGNTAGDAVADALMIAWFKQYNDGQIKTIIEDHWLILDDDDGNVDNGTPHYPHIDGGFRDQGFPGVDLSPLSISHTALTDTLDEVGPYVVTATVTSNVGSNITNVDLLWDAGSGSNMIAMTPTGNPNEYAASIPGQASPAVVEYHIQATDDASNVVNDPSSGDYRFAIGQRTDFFFLEDFETAGDNGWTSVQLASQNDWDHGNPAGSNSADDPNSAFSGTRVWGNDLSLRGSNWNGDYANDVDNYLLSPPLDCSGKLGVQLVYRRWLNVEDGVWDQASIEVSNDGVNFTRVWVNPPGDGDDQFQDTSWVAQTVDLAGVADNQSAVRIRFRMQSDGAVIFGGWTLDDVELVALAPGTDQTPPTDVTNLSSTSHSPSIWNDAASVAMSWTASTDGGSGLDGYSVVFDQNPSTVAPQTKNIEETATTFSQALSTSASGYYFHIRPVDNSGNWGNTVHAGPYLVDTELPGPVSGLQSSSHTASSWSNDPNIDLDWTAATDSPSGLDGYGISTSSAPQLPAEVKDLGTVTSTTVSPGDGASIYFNIRSLDVAGNWDDDSESIGPFQIDTVAPTSGTIQVAGGAGSTPDLVVSLSGLGADEPLSGLQTMQFSNDGSTWSAEEPYAASRAGWDLSSFGGNGSIGTKAVFVRYRDAAGNLSGSSSDTIEYTPVPSIDSISPSRGPSTGGNTVTISGTGFTSDASVTIDGTAASVTFINQTTLQVVVPENLFAAPDSGNPRRMAKDVDVVVTTPHGNDTAADGYTYTLKR
ncbi:MAG: IPT/TIG domain-containing protein [Planctomycetota bacterium]